MAGHVDAGSTPPVAVEILAPPPCASRVPVQNLFMTTAAPREKLNVTVPEAARLLGIGVTLAYEMAAAGQIPTLRIGRRVLVPLEALMRWIRERTNYPDIQDDDRPTANGRADPPAPVKAREARAVPANQRRKVVPVRGVADGGDRSEPPAGLRKLARRRAPEGGGSAAAPGERRTAA